MGDVFGFKTDHLEKPKASRTIEIYSKSDHCKIELSRVELTAIIDGLQLLLDEEPEAEIVIKEIVQKFRAFREREREQGIKKFKKSTKEIDWESM
jgi:hypothetical protein